MNPKYDKSQVDAKALVEGLIAQSTNPQTHWYGQWRSRLKAGELTTAVHFQERGIHGIKEVDDDGQALWWCGLTSNSSGDLMLEHGHLHKGEIVTIFDWLLIPKPYGKTTVICQKCTEQWPYETYGADVGEHVCRLAARG